MTVVGLMYGLHFLDLYNKGHDWLDDTYKCSLHLVGYTPNQDTHDFKDDLTSEHATSGGYTAGGVTLTTKTITYTAGTNKVMLDCDDPVWAASTITAVRTAVFYNDTPATAATKGLLCYQQSDADIGSISGEFRVQINASGLVEITVS
jgi:hypothetical protein